MVNNKKVHQAIGVRIRELRIQAGYTSYENFAFEHDLSARYYWGVEKGRNISLKYLLNVLEILQVDFKEFVESLSFD